MNIANILTQDKEAAKFAASKRLKTLLQNRL